MRWGSGHPDESFGRRLVIICARGCRWLRLEGREGSLAVEGFGSVELQRRLGQQGSIGEDTKTGLEIFMGELLRPRTAFPAQDSTRRERPSTGWQGTSLASRPLLPWTPPPAEGLG